MQGKCEQHVSLNELSTSKSANKLKTIYSKKKFKSQGMAACAGKMHITGFFFTVKPLISNKAGYFLGKLLKLNKMSKIGLFEDIN